MRHGIDWQTIINYPHLSHSSFETIRRNELEGEDIDPLVDEKLKHCKSIETLVAHMKQYFNDSSLRLNNT